MFYKLAQKILLYVTFCASVMSTFKSRIIGGFGIIGGSDIVIILNSRRGGGKIREEKVKNAFCIDSFCFLIQFPVSVSRDLIFSVSLGLRIIPLFDLAYRLAHRALRGMQDADRIESDGTSNSKVAILLFSSSLLFYFFQPFFFGNLQC